MKNMSKLKHQKKSSWYYIFWGTASAAVIAGQIYIGIGYRIMTQSVLIAFDLPPGYLKGVLRDLIDININ
jgi:hypothetical protein